MEKRGRVEVGNENSRSVVSGKPADTVDEEGEPICVGEKTHKLPKPDPRVGEEEPEHKA